MFEKGRLLPDADLVLLDGTRRHLWDFRQKCHLLLLMGDPTSVAAAADKLAERAKTLTWLNVQVLPIANVPDGFSPGAWTVDRFGDLMETYPLDDQLPDRIERDVLYYEACRC